MKIKTLAAICKREGAFCIYDKVDTESGEVTAQWLGTRAAVFPVPSGIPLLSEDAIVALFDITEKQREKLYFHRSPLPASINFGDGDHGEILLDREWCTLGYHGRIVRPVLTRGGLEFIDAAYLTPLADIADELELYERRTESGGVYFAAKYGLMIAGVIMPLNIVEERLVDNLETLAAKCRAALALKTEREKEREAANLAANGMQTSLDGEAVEA